jgi:hypothetical protein
MPPAFFVSQDQQMAEITFMGGEGGGDVGCNEWRNTMTGQSIEFPLRKPVTVDPSNAVNEQERVFFEHVIARARRNKFFRVSDTASAADEATFNGQ